GHERLRADVCELRAAVLRRESSGRIEPLDEGGVHERVPAPFPFLDSTHGKTEPSNGILVDEPGIERSSRLTSPDDARIARVRPRGTNLTVLVRVRAEVVKGDGLPMIVEQRGFRGEEEPGET